VTECNGCGCCCSPVVLSFTQAEARGGPAAAAMSPEDRRFVLEDLTPISRRAGDALGAYWIGELETARGQPWRGRNGSPLRFYFRCRHFDEESRRCLNYDDRPPLCRAFPFHGAPPMPGQALPPPCSFRADLGQPVEPVAVFLSRRPGV
jgi:Fe-S-cluster containining protein